MSRSSRVLTGFLLPLFLAPRAAPGLASSSSTGPPKIKAVQVLIIDTPDLESTRTRLQQYRKAGVDTIIVRSFHLAGDRPHLPAAPVALEAEGVYFPTSRAPVIKDILTPFTVICRQEGFRIYAWMVTRKAGFDNGTVPRDVRYDPADGTLETSSDLDILNPAVEDYLKGLFMDLAATGIDGILLQDDLASRMAEGFTVSNLDRFRTETGEVSLPYRHLRKVREDDGRTYLKADEAFDPWVRWKTRRIISLAKNLEYAARAVNPDIVVAMNLTYESITDPANGRLWLGHDLKSTLEDGPTYAALMLYHQQIRGELGMGLPEVLDLLERSLDDLQRALENRSRVILKFQTRDWTTGQPIPPDELISALMTSWGKGWSVALVPQPTPDQMSGLRTVLGEL